VLAYSVINWSWLTEKPNKRVTLKNFKTLGLMLIHFTIIKIIKGLINLEAKRKKKKAKTCLLWKLKEKEKVWFL
jgi:hypothetical protein